MTIRKIIVLTLASTFFAFAVFGLVQEPKARDAAATSAEAQAAEPTPHHLAIQALAGVWDSEVEFVADPSAPMKSRGVETIRPCGDLWVVGDLEADFMGAPFRGHWVAGFDAKKGKHVGVWVDSMGDFLTTSEGTCEAKCAKIRSEMSMPDPATGLPTKFREIAEQPNADTRTFQMFAVSPEGKETLWMKGTYRRRK